MKREKRNRPSALPLKTSRDGKGGGVLWPPRWLPRRDHNKKAFRCLSLCAVLSEEKKILPITKPSTIRRGRGGKDPAKDLDDLLKKGQNKILAKAVAWIALREEEKKKNRKNGQSIFTLSRKWKGGDGEALR